MKESGNRTNITDAVGVARALAQLRRMTKILRRLGKAPDSGFDPLQTVEEALGGLASQQWARRANDKLMALLEAVAEGGPGATRQLGSRAQTLLAEFQTHLGRRVYVSTADDGDRDFQSALAYDKGLDAARHGVQLLAVAMTETVPAGVPERWADRQMARMRWFEDGGDPAVGIPPASGWVLADDQAGTLLAELLQVHHDHEQAAPTPDQLLADSASPRWLRDSLHGALQRDPVKAAAEADVMARSLRQRADSILAFAVRNLRPQQAGQDHATAIADSARIGPTA